MASSSNGNQKVVQTPKEIEAIENILKDMGVEEAEAGVVMSLYNLVYFYVSTNLDDAQIYAQHAKRKEIAIDDIKLAMKMNSDKMFTSPPPRELMMELARTLNNRSLPSIKSLSGPRLPPDRCCLTAPNYTLKTYKKPPTSMAGSSNALPFTSKLDPSMSHSTTLTGGGLMQGNIGGSSGTGLMSPSGGSIKLQPAPTPGVSSISGRSQYTTVPNIMNRQPTAMDDGSFLPISSRKRPYED